MERRTYQDRGLFSKPICTKEERMAQPVSRRPSYSQAMLNYLCRAKSMKYDVWKNIAGIYGQGREHMDWMPAQPSPISSWTRTKIWKLDINLAYVYVYVYVMALTGSSASFPGCYHLQSLIDCNMQIQRRKAAPHVCLLSVHLTPHINLFLHFFFLCWLMYFTWRWPYVIIKSIDVLPAPGRSWWPINMPCVSAKRANGRDLCWFCSGLPTRIIL